MMEILCVACWMSGSETDHTLECTRLLEGSVRSFSKGKSDGQMASYYLVTPLQRFKERIEALLALHHRNILGFFGHITIEDIVYSVCRVHPPGDFLNTLAMLGQSMGGEWKHTRIYSTKSRCRSDASSRRCCIRFVQIQHGRFVSAANIRR